MVQTARNQTDCLDIETLYRVFVPLRDTVYKQAGMQAYTVRLDKRILL